MIRTVATLSAVAALMAVGAIPASAQAKDPTGVWINQERSTAVRVARCGEALCGNVVWLAEPLDKQGKPKVDRHNPDTKLRGRRLIGLPVLLSMKPRWRQPLVRAHLQCRRWQHLRLACSIGIAQCNAGSRLRARRTDLPQDELDARYRRPICQGGQIGSPESEAS